MSDKTGKTFHGGRLRLARTFHRLTLADMGEEICVSRQYLQRLEADPTVSPSSEMIQVLAETLQVESKFFFEPMRGELQEEVCHFRKLRTTPLYLRRKALASGTMFNAIVDYLAAAFELPKVDIPPVSGRSPENIERAAEKCRLRWGLHIDAPIHNMVRTAERAGAVTTTFEGISPDIDAFSYTYSRPIVVRNTAKSSTSRARFDIAHEFGHLVLHQGIESDEPGLEDEANRFASAFLLPRAGFLREFPRSSRLNWTNLFSMKKRWGVSIQAIIRRAYDLTLLGAVQYRTSNIYIGRNGWKTAEPGEDEIPSEHPEIIPSAFELLAEQGTYAEDTARELGLSVSILDKFGVPIILPPPKPESGKIVHFEREKAKRDTGTTVSSDSGCGG